MDDAEYVEYVRGRLPALRRLAFLLCGHEPRADDLVQQTITTLYVKWPKAQAARNLDGYVRTMLVRTFIDERRLAWARVRLFGAVPEPPPVPLTDDVEDRAVLRDALARLPKKQRAVLVLRFLQDLPVDEVAEILGCSPGTVKSQTSHGLAALRRLLDSPPKVRQ
ncbi:SigE family RNA polymerase sigma factor [Virgisporangium ochraceum]|jgi:RNA polymerase sigma-70 factor (sigma-E family)|uniref:RNA polymerase sigma24 factor n=1 Tax=Virgisporangium ochraceum TaxID=65505 RepID=A0A8J3ZSR1_9ACTN|nr:SigE family RNA polymerase sigma factor [Virgisporangium ochraceum]GIJ69239.1 RNA polymerase sigma24 factor [Virgisporangium ochraceum]